MAGNWKYITGGVILMGLLIAGGNYGQYWWQTGRFIEETDDAYVQADYTTIAPKVSGYISDVTVEDNQAVKAGEVLARIDDRDLKTALDQARADVASAESDVKSIAEQMTEQESVIDQGSAAIASDQAGVSFAKSDYERYKNLEHSQIASTQQVQRTLAAYQQQTAGMQRDRAALAAARGQADVLATARVRAETQLQHMQALLDQAKLNLSYATLVSPIDGTVGARSLRVGQYVQAGTQLMAIVPLHAVYIIGNFKETQLSDMRPGQQVSIKVDTFSGRTIMGHIDSLAPASGLTFALLPPDNATGNFTKIVQRIPVKIALDAQNDDIAGLLRPGMSAEVAINTRGVAATDTKVPALAGNKAQAEIAAR